jgi:hypothetical protein
LVAIEAKYLCFIYETLIDASKEGGLEINIEKTKYMLLSRHQNAGNIGT